MVEFALVDKTTGRIVQEGEKLKNTYCLLNRVVTHTVIEFETEYFANGEKQQYSDVIYPDNPHYQIIKLPTVGTKGESDDTTINDTGALS